MENWSDEEDPTDIEIIEKPILLKKSGCKCKKLLFASKSSSVISPFKIFYRFIIYYRKSSNL